MISIITWSVDLAVFTAKETPHSRRQLMASMTDGIAVHNGPDQGPANYYRNSEIGVTYKLPRRTAVNACKYSR